jgi:hypothetical protein
MEVSVLLIEAQSVLFEVQENNAFACCIGVQATIIDLDGINRWTYSLWERRLDHKFSARHSWLMNYCFNDDGIVRPASCCGKTCLGGHKRGKVIFACLLSTSSTEADYLAYGGAKPMLELRLLSVVYAV